MDTNDKLNTLKQALLHGIDKLKCTKCNSTNVETYLDPKSIPPPPKPKSIDVWRDDSEPHSSSKKLVMIYI